MSLSPELLTSRVFNYKTIHYSLHLFRVVEYDTLDSTCDDYRAGGGGRIIVKRFCTPTFADPSMLQWKYKGGFFRACQQQVQYLEMDGGAPFLDPLGI